MSLKDRLDAMRAASATKVPPAAQQVMHRVTEDLRKSGILDRVVKVGSRAPDFALPNANAEIVASKALLGKGPLVVSFYRGKW